MTTTVYTYDKGHNRTSKTVNGAATTYVIGNGSNGAGANQIVSETTGGVTTGYGYDANGNRTSRAVGGATDAYGYDYENRLVGLNYQTGSSGTGTYAYGYDYRTRRVARTEPGPVTTHVVFDGGNSIMEYGTRGTSSSYVEYIRGHGYGGGVGGLEYSVRNGAASFNHYNSRGDVVTKTSATGTPTYQAAYEAFGKHPTESGSTSDRQKASTKEEDPTGLLNEGFRYRDSGTGTFLTRDPLGFKAGPNMYTYVRQNPWTKFDPEGLDNNPPPPPAPPAATTAQHPPPSKSTTNTPAGPAGSVGGGGFTGGSGSTAGGGAGGSWQTAESGDSHSASSPPGSSQPAATSNGPKLTFDMRTPQQIAAQAAASFGLSSSNFGPPTSPTTSARSTQQQTSGSVSAIDRATTQLNIDQTYKDTGKGNANGIYVTHYGPGTKVGGWDKSNDPDTNRGVGNRNDNKLNSNSLAISKDLAASAGLKKGDPVYVNGKYIGNYDDKPGRSGTIDVYDPQNKVGKQNWGGMVWGAQIKNNP